MVSCDLNFENGRSPRRLQLDSTPGISTSQSLFLRVSALLPAMRAMSKITFQSIGSPALMILT